MSCAVKFDNFKKKLKETDVVIVLRKFFVVLSYTIFNMVLLRKLYNEQYLKTRFLLIVQIKRKIKSLFWMTNSSNSNNILLTESHRLNIKPVKNLKLLKLYFLFRIRWAASTPLPTEANHFGLAALDSKIYLVSGGSGVNNTATRSLVSSETSNFKLRTTLSHFSDTS
jgi:hypothetical protein